MVPFIVRILKEDSLGRVECISGSPAGKDGPRITRRVACGGRWPLSRWLARKLLKREQRALTELAPMPGVPRLSQDATWSQVPTPGRGIPRPADVLLRSFIAGEPLHKAEVLPVNFFDRLEELVVRMHACGVCHNDLHKEQNILVSTGGMPALIDFQLASRHRAGQRKFLTRCHEDLRHVQKHRRRYLRDGRGPSGQHEDQAIRSGAGAGLRRKPLSLVWRRTFKPVYQFVTRRILKRWDGEERRESSGPWPSWSAPVGPWKE